jgi:hypothetical protein
MFEILTKFTEPTRSENGELYWAEVHGSVGEDGLWRGWIEFVAESDGTTVRTPGETVQPNRKDLEYWATGLTSVYLEGALARALEPVRSATESRA